MRKNPDLNSHIFSAEKLTCKDTNFCARMQVFLNKTQGWRMRFSKISVKNMNDYVK